MTATLALLIHLFAGQAADPSAVVAPSPKSDDSAAASQLEVLETQNQDLESHLGELEAERQADQQDLLSLEKGLADEQAQREQADQGLSQGREALSFAAAGLAGVEQVLAGGSGEVWDTLSQADAAAAFARGASAGQSPEGSALAAETQRWLDASQQALERGDLYWARMTVRAARQAADRALSFLPPGAGGGASGGAPPSEY